METKVRRYRSRSFWIFGVLVILTAVYYVFEYTSLFHYPNGEVDVNRVIVVIVFFVFFAAVIESLVSAGARRRRY